MTSHQGPSRGLHLPAKRLQTPSAPKPTTPTTTPHTTAEPEVLTAKGKKRQRPRNIACISCNRQKKTCGSIRPCPRCVHLGVPCRQPVKPEGFVYNTKKQKIADGPLSPPVSPDDHNALMLALKQAAEINRQQKGFLPQNLPPSPSPSVSTVGTPRDFITPASSYNDPATGKHRDITELNSCMSPYSVPHHNEVPKPLPLLPDMSRWFLPALPSPAEEVPYNVVKNSLFNSAPVFGLEKSIFDSELTGNNPFTGFGEPADLADLYTGVAGGVGVQGTKEQEGEGGEHEEERGDEGKDDAEVGNAVTQGPPVVAAGSTMSGIASETGCGSGISWLDAADLLTDDDLVMDDVDLSNLDITGLDNTVVESDIQQLLELSISKPPAISGSPPSRP